ncbi:MAG: oligosaccharide flippase family protein [Patescibacteria group bacterium]
MGYTKNAISGFSWQTVLTITTAAITTGKLMILARLLTQNDFGLFAYVIIALGLTESLTQTGVNVTLLQAKRSLTEYINTAWIISIFRGLLIAAVMTVLGLAMSSFFAEPTLWLLIGTASLIPIIKGFINPYIISYQKELAFFKESAFRLSLITIEALATIAFVWYWRSVSGMIVGMMIAAAAEVLLTFCIFKCRPVWQYSRDRAREIFHNARGLSLGAALHYINEHVDDIILGRSLGTASLGVYHNAYALGHRPTYGFAQALTHSTLPVFVRIAEDTSRLRKAYLRSSVGLGGLAGLGMLVAVLFPDIVVRIILGDGWLDVVPVLPWLAVAGFIEAQTAMGYTVLIALKKYWLMNIHRILGIIILIPSLVIGLSWFGIVGAGIAWVLSRIVITPILAIMLYKELR